MDIETNLAATAAARKERLIALRKRKANHDAGGSTSGTFTFKQRNFDPETRQARVRVAGEAEENTVEKEVEGLAEAIVAEDEERRAEELVSGCFWWILFELQLTRVLRRTCSTSSPSARIGTSSAT